MPPRCSSMGVAAAILAWSRIALVAGGESSDSAPVYPTNDQVPYHVGTPYREQGNLLRNGSFEGGLESWHVDVLAGSPTVTVDASRALDGRQSLRIDLPTETDRVRVFQEIRGLLPGAYQKKVRYMWRGGHCPSVPGRFDVTGPDGRDVLGTTPRGDMHRRPVAGPYGDIEAVWQEDGWWVASDNQRRVPDSVIGRDGTRIDLGPEDLRGTLKLGYTFRGKGTIWFDGAEVRITSRLESARDMGYLPAMPPMTDASLFDAIDLSRPGLDTVKAAVEARNWEHARREFLKHLRARVWPQHFFTADRRRDYRNEYSPERVARYARKFEETFLPVWQSYDPSSDSEFTWQFSSLRGAVGSVTHPVYDQRVGRLGCVLASYFRTGEQHWLATYRHALGSLFQAIRPPLRFPCTRYGGVGIWDPLDVAIRLDDRLEEYFLLLSSDELSIGEHAMFWKYFLEHARFTEINNRNQWGSNHQTHQMQREYVWAVLLNEFKESEVWREQGLTTLDQHLTTGTLADGGHHERQSGYSLSVLMNFARTLALARANNLPVPASFGERLERMFEWFMYVTLPDGSLPPMGDWVVLGNGALERREATLGALLYPNRDDFLFLAERDPDTRLAVAREFFPGATAVPAAEGLASRVGVVPRRLSVCLPSTQWIVMRSAWTPEALALVLDYAPFVAHSHRDAQGISLWAYNKPLLMDSRSGHGSAGYAASGFGSWDMRTFAHNTVEIDDKDQPEKAGRLAQWTTFSGFDFSHTVIEDYAGCDHHRRILFVKPDYWIVSDVVTGNDAHTMKWYAHFVRGTVVTDPARLTASLVRPDGPGLLVASGADSELSLETRLGFMFGTEMDTPYIWYQRDGTPPVRFDVLLSPFRDAEGVSRAWESRVDDAGVVATIPRAGDRRDVYIRANTDVARLGPYELEGKFALIRYAGDAVTGLLLIQGASLKQDGDVVLRLDHRTPALSMTFLGDGLAVETDGEPGPIVTGLAPGGKATINGRPARVRKVADGWELRP